MAPHRVLEGFDIDIRFCLIGMMVITWGMIDHLISQLVIILYHKCDGKNTKYCQKRGMPRTQLKRKLTFLNEIFNSPVLSKYKTNGLSILSKTDKLSGVRDSIIHGALLDETKELFRFKKYLFNKLAKLENIPKSNDFEYTHHDLVKYQKEMMALAESLLNLLDGLHNEFQ